MITVRELVSMLQKVNQNAYVHFDCSEACKVFAVEDVYCSPIFQREGYGSICYILDKKDE